MPLPPLFDDPIAIIVPADAEAQHILEQASKLRDDVAARLTSIFGLLWNNPKGVQAADILASLGTKAGPLFAASAGLKNLLAATKTGFVLDIPVPVTVHEDGTVTID